MDEPSAALSPRETKGLFKVIDELKSHGIGIIYISHRLDEIFKVADRVTILRDGEHIDTRPITSLTREKMIELMVGRSLEKEFPKHEATLGQARFEVTNLRTRLPSARGFVQYPSRRGARSHRSCGFRSHRDRPTAIRCRPS